MAIERHLSFKVKGNTYTVQFPTVAQFIDIESTKAKLASNGYNQMIKANTLLSNKALDFVDMTSYLTVLCPELMKDLKAQSILHMDIFDAKELMKAYSEQFVPWLNEWQKVLSEIEPVKKEEQVDDFDSELAEGE